MIKAVCMLLIPFCFMFFLIIPTASIAQSCGCPTSVKVANRTTESLAAVYPTYKTGLGMAATMEVGPARTTWDGATVTESVTQSSNDCPSTWGTDLCTNDGTSGHSDFPVGEPGGVILFDGTRLSSKTNSFYDEHIIANQADLLGSFGQGKTTCTVKCSQKYSCDGNIIGTFTITFTFTKGTVNGQPATIVSATKQ